MTTETAPTGDVQAAIDAARPDVTNLDTVNAATALARRDDVVVEIVDMERHLLSPIRQSGTLKALTAEGFIDAVKRLASGPDSTIPAVVYANVDAVELVAILNDDQGAQPGWRDFRVGFTPQATPEWKHWLDHQGLGDQAVFARVLEDGQMEIRNPSSTVMLDLAQTFNASTTAKFKQAGRLKDGRTQLVYEEEIEATAGEGIASIPDSFTIEVRPFYGATPVEVECTLRYRIDRGDLKIGYSILRPAEISRKSFEDDVVTAVTAAGLTVLAAIPAPAR